MIASCSAWIVVTMSRIVDPRGAFSAASSAGSDADPESASAVQHVVVEIGDPLVGRRSGELEMASPGHAERRGQRRAVERLRSGRPPVDERALPVRGIGEPDAADVARRPVGVVEPAEAQPRAGGGQRADPLRPAVHGDVALPAGAELPARRRGQRAPRLGRGGRELGGEQRMQPADPPGLAASSCSKGGLSTPSPAVLRSRCRECNSFSDSTHQNSFPVFICAKAHRVPIRRRRPRRCPASCSTCCRWATAASPRGSPATPPAARRAAGR